MAVITYDFIKTKMKHYAAILEQRGDTSKMAADFRAKQVAIIRKYARNQADLDPNAIPVMEDYINTFADNKTKDIALAKFKEFVKITIICRPWNRQDQIHQKIKSRLLLRKNALVQFIQIKIKSLSTMYLRLCLLIWG